MDGNLEVASSSGLYNEGVGLINVDGKLTLKETRLRNRAGGKITGSGEITGPIASGPLIVNEGLIEPGAGLATLTIGDDFQQLAGGQLKMEVSGGATPANDSLQTAGTASLLGSLSVSRVGDATLAEGDSFTLLTATGGVTGEFQQLTMPTLAPELFWYMHYAATEVRAIVAEVMPGDFNRNGIIGARRLCVVAEQRRDPGAVHRLGRQLRPHHRTRCTALPAQVPEPTGWLLALVAAVICLTKHPPHRLNEFDELRPSAFPLPHSPLPASYCSSHTNTNRRSNLGAHFPQAISVRRCRCTTCRHAGHVPLNRALGRTTSSP